MNNNFTEKSMEALQAGQRLAARLNHQQMDVEHLAHSLLEQEHGLATSILQKAEVAVESLKAKVSKELDKVPKVHGGQGDIGITSRLNRVLGGRR